MSASVEVMDPHGRAVPKIINALLLDDSTFDRARIRRMSKQTEMLLDLTEVATIDALKDAVAMRAFDLILIDYRLPQGDGLEVLEHVQNSALNSDVATIMITGEGDLETAVTAMRNGCHDFLTKDAMTADQLRFSMLGALRTAQDSRDLAAQTAHQREIIKQGLTAALLDREVQGTVIALFKQQVADVMDVTRAPAVMPQDHSDLEALLATLGSDEDEFIFR